MADGSVIIDINADSKKFKEALGSLGGIATTALKGVTAAVAAVGTAMTTAGTYAIKVGSDFEAGMSKVKSISGASAQDMDLLGKKAEEMGAKTKFSATESADAFSYMAMAGWKTGDMLSGIEGIMNLAAASGEDLALTSDIVTDALTAFGLKAEDSGHFADVLAQASSNANTNVAMMGETFKYCAPVAGALGFSVEDTAVAIGLMANSGIKASQAGTALRSLFTRLVKPPKQAAEAIKDLNLEVTNSDGSMRTWAEIMGDLRVKFADLTEAEKASYAAKLAGQEAMSGLLAIVNASEADFQKLTEAIANSDGATLRMAETMQDNLKGAVTILGSTVEGLGIAFYKNVKQTATESVKSLTSALSSSAFRASFNDFSVAAAKMIEQITRLAVGAIPVLLDAFTFLASHFQIIIGLVGAAVAAFATFQTINTVTQVISGAITAFTAMSTALRAFIAFNGAAAFSQAALNGTFTLSQILVAALTGKMTLLTAAHAAWNTVMLANPIGLVVAAVAALSVGLVAFIALTDDSVDATGELIEESEALISTSEDLNKELKDTAEQRKKNKDAIEKEGAATKALANQLYELAGKTNKTAGEKQLMLSMVEKLNQAIPGLNLQYDKENDLLNKQQSEVLGVLNTHQDLLKAQAAEKDYIAIVEEISQVERERNELEQKRYELKEALEEKQRQLFEAEQKYGESPYLREEVRRLTEAYDENSAAIDANIAEKERLDQSLHNTKEYIEDCADSAKDSADSFEAMGDAMENTTAITGKFSTVLLDTADSGKDAVKDLESSLESYEDTATNVFSTIEQKSALSFEQMMENLKKNQEAMSAWSDNMKLAAEKGMDEGLLKVFRDAGPELGLQLQYIVGLSGEKFNALNEQFRQGVEVANETFEEVDLEPMGLKIKEGVDNTIEIFKTLPGSLKETIQEANEALAESLASGKTIVEPGARELKNSIKDILASLPDDVKPIGRSIAEGLVAGMEEGKRGLLNAAWDMASKTIEEMKASIDSHSPSRKAANEVGRPIVQGVAKGAEEEMPNLLGLVSRGMTSAIGVMQNLINASNTRPAAQNAVNGVTKEFDRLPTELSSIIADSMKNVLSAISSSAPSISSSAEFIRESAVTPLQSLPEEYQSIGQLMAEGLWSGMDSMRGWITDQIQSFADSLVEAARDAAEIHSPSRRMAREVGKPIMEGIGAGMRQELPNVESLAAGQLSELVGRMQSAVASTQSSIGGNALAQMPAYSSSTSSHITTGGVTVNWYGGGDDVDVGRLARKLNDMTYSKLRSKGAII